MRRTLIHVEVKDKSEGENIERALADPMTRAFVTIVGALLPLGDRARTRVLSFINDKVNEEAGSVTIESPGDRHTADVVAPLGTAQ